MVNGDAKERELVREIDAKPDWTAMRAPSSGSATDRDLPDVLAGSDGRALAIELKSSGGDPVYIPEDEVTSLHQFAAAFGAEAWIAARWSSRTLQDATFYLQQPHRMYRTDSGSYRAKYEDCAASWQSLAEILNAD